VSFNAGATSRHENYDRQGVTSTDQGVFNVFRHFNFSNQAPIQYSQVRNIVGAYGQGWIWLQQILITVAARNDWVSNTFDNSIAYPSASMSFIPSKSICGNNIKNGINFLKLRAGWELPPVLPLVIRLQIQLTVWQGIFQILWCSFGFTKHEPWFRKPNLQPELYSEVELGLEAKLVDNRITLDFSFKRKKTENLITNSLCELNRVHKHIYQHWLNGRWWFWIWLDYMLLETLIVDSTGI
jgi:outer membrane receptor protein involved in Fe transport